MSLKNTGETPPLASHCKMEELIELNAVKVVLYVLLSVLSGVKAMLVRFGFLRIDLF